jgi:hypothetical protein
MADDDVGAALSGADTPDDTQTKNIVQPSAVASQWSGFLDNPTNRTALLQMGLQLMQPMAYGQTGIGQIGQAIGAGGEAVGRQEAADLEEQQSQNKLDIANQRMAIAQQRADTAEKSALRRGLGGISATTQARFDRQDSLQAKRDAQTSKTRTTTYMTLRLIRTIQRWRNIRAKHGRKSVSRYVQNAQAAQPGRRQSLRPSYKADTHMFSNLMGHISNGSGSKASV